MVHLFPFWKPSKLKNLDFVLVRHEGSAGFMADAVAQYTDNIGVCLSTLGPGALPISSVVLRVPI